MTTLRPFNLELRHIWQFQMFQQAAIKERFDTAFGVDSDRLWVEFQANGRTLLALDLDRDNCRAAVGLIYYLALV